jgi:multiple sugar transport system permease protein
MSNAQNPASASTAAGITTTDKDASARRTTPREHKVDGMSRGQNILRYVVLFIGALVFLFPFYYMVIGSLQTTPDPTVAGAFPNPGNLTLENYAAINGRIDLLQGLVNSGIFAGGVILCTVVFGVLVGYALAQLEWRGRGVTFALVLLVQVVPFQLLMIPLYVMIARDYGLADNYLGMILPFAINSTAVLIFRQYFLQVPKSLFDAARIDGAGELKILRSIALPLVRPALLTVVLLTFIGPWNEFLWPFLITKEASLQPLAVSLANYLSNVAATAANPFGAILAGACVLAAPAVVLFILFQRHFVSSDIGSGVKG